MRLIARKISRNNRHAFVSLILILLLFSTLNIQVIADSDNNSNLITKYNTTLLSDFPIHYDLRDVEGNNYVTTVKHQTDGTCWTHGVMASIEGNLLTSENWDRYGIIDEPNLAEYHLDWWNGFNKYFNSDSSPVTGNGLNVHKGGDYLVASAYITRGEGAIYSEDANDDTEYDNNWFFNTPERFSDEYYPFYVSDIEWFSVEDDLSNIDVVKRALMENGVVGTCLAYNSIFIDDFIHYQPKQSATNPNHAVAIVGWDDEKITQASEPGAWLCKNSWGSNWGLDGYFWISYYDKHCGKHLDMGAVSFKNVILSPYSHIYYHDYHGWRDTLEYAEEAFNVFKAENNETITAVSFYTSKNHVNYTIRIYDKFENNILDEELSTISGYIEYKGFHTVDLDETVDIKKNDEFYLYLRLSDGGQAYDKTSIVPVLLGKGEFSNTLVISESKPGESYYKNGTQWDDLYETDNSANFCIKALVGSNPDLETEGKLIWKNVKPNDTLYGSFKIINAGDSKSKLSWEIVEYPNWGLWNFSELSGNNLSPEEEVNITVKITAPDNKNKDFTGKIKIVNKKDNSDYEIIEITLSTKKNFQIKYTQIIEIIQKFLQNFSILENFKQF